MLSGRRIGEHLVAHVAAAQWISIDYILAQSERIGNHRRHRLDGGRIHLAKLFDPAKDIVEFGHHRLNLILRYGDPGERGDFADGCAID